MLIMSKYTQGYTNQHQNHITFVTIYSMSINETQHYDDNPNQSGWSGLLQWKNTDKFQKCVL